MLRPYPQYASVIPNTQPDGFNRYNSFQAKLEAALGQRPDFFEALAVDGTVLYELRQDAAARQALERAHALRPDDEAVSRLLTQLNHESPR